MVNYNFTGKVALVTGGTSGIGKATALRFSQCGARVVILDASDINSGHLIAEIEKKGHDVLFIKCDVRNEVQVKEAIEYILIKYGRLDFAYNNAGVGGDFALVENYPAADWDFVMDVNLKGVFLCMKYEIPAILKNRGGAIVNCASVLSMVGYENDTAYVASKFGVLGLTKNAALDYAGTSLRINCVSPGFTKTPMIMMGDENKLKNLEKKHPAGRLANPEEIANAVMWLCSNDSSFVLGHNLVADGGYTII